MPGDPTHLQIKQNTLTNAVIFPFCTFWSHFSLVCYPCRDQSGKLTTERRNSMCLLLLLFKLKIKLRSWLKVHIHTSLGSVSLCWRIITPLSLQVLFYATILIFSSHCPRHKEEIGCFQFYCGLNKVRQQYRVHLHIFIVSLLRKLFPSFLFQ